MARTQAEVLSGQIGAMHLEMARLQATVEALQEEVATLKGKLPIETAALHEAKKRTA